MNEDIAKDSLHAATLDRLDRRILAALQANGRISNQRTGRPGAPVTGAVQPAPPPAGGHGRDPPLRSASGRRPPGPGRDRLRAHLDGARTAQGGAEVPAHRRQDAAGAGVLRGDRRLRLRLQGGRTRFSRACPTSCSARWRSSLASAGRALEHLPERAQVHRARCRWSEARRRPSQAPASSTIAARRRTLPGRHAWVACSRLPITLYQSILRVARP